MRGYRPPPSLTNSPPSLPPAPSRRDANPNTHTYTGKKRPFSEFGIGVPVSPLTTTENPSAISTRPNKQPRRLQERFKFPGLPTETATTEFIGSATLAAASRPEENIIPEDLLARPASSTPLPPNYDRSAPLPGKPRPKYLAAMSTPYSLKPKKQRRCKAWDTSGYCPRGPSCKYEHIMAPKFPDPSVNPLEYYDPCKPGLQASGHQQPQPVSFAPSFLDPTFTMQFLPSQNNNKAFSMDALLSFPAEETTMDYDRTIVVEEIPKENYTDHFIKQYFSQFGNVVRVSLPVTPLRSAIVTFQAHNSALQAFNSPKAVFDNRFVKVSWYTAWIAGSPIENNLYGANDSEDIDMESFLQRQVEAQKNFEERLRKKKELEEERQQVAKRREGLEEEICQFRRNCAAKGIELPSNGQEAFSGSGSSSEGLSTADLKAKLAQVEAEARMLGIDPDDDTESVADWPLASRGSFRGRGYSYARYKIRGSFRGYWYRSRGTFSSIHEAFAHYSLDNRPKQVLVSGPDFSTTERDQALRYHLIAIGEFSGISHDSKGTTVSFKDHKSAKKFFDSIQDSGRVRGIDDAVHISWVQNETSKVTAEDTYRTTSQGTNPESEPGAIRDEANSKQYSDAFESTTGLPDIKQEAGSEGDQENANVDYDVADDDTWDIS